MAHFPTIAGMLAATTLSWTGAALAEAHNDRSNVVGAWQRVKDETRAIYTGSDHGVVTGSGFIEGDETDWTLHVFSERAGAFAGESCSVNKCEQFIGILQGRGFYAVDEDSYYFGEVDGDRLEFCMLEAGSVKIAGCMVYMRTDTDPLMEALSGRTLVNSGRSLTLNADGTLTGTDLSGTWSIEDSLFCRTLLTGPETFGVAECQNVIVDGTEITFFSPTGRTATYLME